MSQSDSLYVMWIQFLYDSCYKVVILTTTMHEVLIICNSSFLLSPPVFHFLLSSKMIFSLSPFLFSSAPPFRVPKTTNSKLILKHFSGPWTPKLLKPEALTSQLWVRVCVYVGECVFQCACLCVCLCFQGLDIQRSRGPSLQSLTSVKSTATSVNLCNKNSQVLTNRWDSPGCGAVCGHVFSCMSNMDDLDFFLCTFFFSKSI